MNTLCLLLLVLAAGSIVDAKKIHRIRIRQGVRSIVSGEKDEACKKIGPGKNNIDSCELCLKSGCGYFVGDSKLVQGNLCREQAFLKALQGQLIVYNIGYCEKYIPPDAPGPNASDREKMEYEREKIRTWEWANNDDIRCTRGNNLANLFARCANCVKQRSCGYSLAQHKCLNKKKWDLTIDLTFRGHGESLEEWEEQTIELFSKCNLKENSNAKDKALVDKLLDAALNERLYAYEHYHPDLSLLLKWTDSDEDLNTFVCEHQRSWLARGLRAFLTCGRKTYGVHPWTEVHPKKY